MDEKEKVVSETVRGRRQIPPEQELHGTKLSDVDKSDVDKSEDDEETLAEGLIRRCIADLDAAGKTEVGDALLLVGATLSATLLELNNNFEWLSRCVAHGVAKYK